ncbi:hypothetical protein KKG08_01500 [Patescibacteria group bacterium]|nr:hypothetical protein [Patescibacteria group bacterium]
MLMLKRKKRYWLFVIPAVMLILGSSYYLYLRQKAAFDQELALEIVEIEKESVFECLNTQEIEYLYYAHTDPLWEPNNKFGIYLYAEVKQFFEIAQKLVNSNGGEWGYVLIPYNVKDYDYDKWSRVFDQLRAKNLIPVIQLWNVDVDKYVDQTRRAAEFLNRFIWPIKYRYVSVYNEPNSANFWYGTINPEEYARILDYSITIFKEQNEDFYILNGALNVSAPTNANHMDSFTFMKKMEEEEPGIFERLDGWASHPYPQPNFSGNPTDTGRWSIKAYDEELRFLKEDLGVEKDLPVFITETGWAHAEGTVYNPSFLPVKTVGEYFKQAYEDVWLKDDRVRAVMPFTIRYNPPFDHFSWVNIDYVPYYHYDVVKSISKVKSEPPQLIMETITIGGCDE